MKLSIRLQLTLWYALILIITTAVYSVVATVISERQFQRTPYEVLQQVNQVQADNYQAWQDGDDTARPLNPHDVIEQIREQDLQSIRLMSAVTFLVLMSLSLLGGYIITGKLLQPLRQLNNATHDITADNLQISLPGFNAHDELGELINNFNAMLARLHQSFDQQKQFIENASHELKTPLTVTQINLEAILHDTDMSRTELETLIHQALTSTTFMNQLIEDLLLLSIANEHIVFQSVNLTQVITAAVDQLQPLAQQANKTIQFTASNSNDGYNKQGNATLLQRAVMNCLENAIKYAKSVIQVKIELNTNHQITINIQDDGEGIPSAALPKVTDRFYRVDSSRSRQSGGSGLGLAITKTIVEQHAGTLIITSTEGNGTTVTIIL